MSGGEENLRKEISIIAERWKWTDESIRNLPILTRRKYVEEICDMYEREHEAYEKARRGI